MSNALLDKIKKSKFFKEIEEGERNEILEKRKQAAKEIQRLEAERAKTIPEMRAVYEKKVAEFKKMEAAIRVLETECNNLRRGMWGESHKYERLIDKQKDILFSTCDERINETVTWFQDRLNAIRKAGMKTQGYESENNIISLTKTVTVYGNRDAVYAAMAYCQNALKLLEKMKLMPEIDMKMIEDLKKNVPDTESPKAFTAMTGEKNMERGQFKYEHPYSDATQDYILRKLHEKADKILSKPAARAYR